MRRRRRARGVGATIAASALALALAGCVTTPTQPTASPTASPSVDPSPSAAPGIVPDGSAADNRAYFDSLNAGFLAAARMPGGRPIIDNLVAGGFDKAAMQVTPDATAIGGAVDSVQFSVRFGDECLIGQTSAAVGYVGAIGPTVSAENCLPGATRPIDW